MKDKDDTIKYKLNNIGEIHGRHKKEVEIGEHEDRKEITEMFNKK